MRTQEQFNETWHQLLWWHRFHKSPVWLVALKDRYVLSVVKPLPEEIAKGTTAHLYDVDLTIIDKVRNNA